MFRLETGIFPHEDRNTPVHQQGQYRLHQTWSDREHDVMNPPHPGLGRALALQTINFPRRGADHGQQNIAELMTPGQDQRSVPEIRNAATLEHRDFAIALDLAREEFDLDFAAAIGQQASMIQDIQNLAAVVRSEPRQSGLDLVTEVEQQALMLQEFEDARAYARAVAGRADLEMEIEMEQQELILQEIRNQAGLARQRPRGGGEAEPLAMVFILNHQYRAGQGSRTEDGVRGPFGIVRRRSNGRTTISNLPFHAADEIVMRDAFGELVLDRPIRH